MSQNTLNCYGRSQKLRVIYHLIAIVVQLLYYLVDFLRSYVCHIDSSSVKQSSFKLSKFYKPRIIGIYFLEFIPQFLGVFRIYHLYQHIHSSFLKF